MTLPRLCALIAVAAPATASAEYTFAGDGVVWPRAAAARSLTLPPGMIEVGGPTVRVSFAADVVDLPAHVTPDVRLGVTQRLTVRLFHHDGLRVSGARVSYEDVGVEMQYEVLGWDAFQLVVTLGPQVRSLRTPRARGYVWGYMWRARLGLLAIDQGLRRYDALDKEFVRGEDPRGGYRDSAYNTAELDLSLRATAQVLPSVGVVAHTGLLVVDTIESSWMASFGVGVLWGATEQMDLGVDLSWPYLFGTNGDRSILSRTPERLGAQHRELVLSVGLRI